MYERVRLALASELEQAHSNAGIGGVVLNKTDS
jgi:hypothetical protein